jgi:hypothetical protein
VEEAAEQTQDNHTSAQDKYAAADQALHRQGQQIVEQEHQTATAQTIGTNATT